MDATEGSSSHHRRSHQSPHQVSAAGHSPLEALPPDVLAAIASLLGPQPHDRVRLAVTSRTLLAASRQPSPGWWGRLDVALRDASAVQGFQSWLAERRPEVCQLEAQALAEDQTFSLPLLPVPHLAALCLSGFSLGRRSLLSILAHTLLTRLQLQQCDTRALPQQISSLTRLTSLGIASAEPPAPQLGLRHLSALPSLTSLELRLASFPGELPPVLRQLSALASLAVRSDHAVTGWQHLPPSLTSLDIHATPFQEQLPADLSGLTRLRRLVARHCRDLEGEWQHLAGLPLTHLVLSDCGLAELPAVVSTLTALQHFDVADPPVWAPNSRGIQHLYGLEQLTYLDLGVLSCQLHPAIGTLTALRSLEFQLQEQDSLSQLSALSGLTSLDASCNGLTHVPTALGGLTALRQLVLAGGSGQQLLQSGWEHLAVLGQLTSLHLRGCSGGRVPAQLSSLTALQELKLTNLDWASGWQCLACLPTLTRLYLCVLEVAGQGSPAAAGQPALRNLRSLTLRRCLLGQTKRGSGTGGGSSSSSSSFLPFAAPQLTSLELYRCSLASLPADILGMPALQELGLQYNDITQGWQHLQRCPFLTHLDLAANGLSQLPAELGACSALRSLRLAFNADLDDTDGAAWQPLASLTNLTALDLGSCELSSLPAALSSLAALRTLGLEHDSPCEGGWQHLEQLPFLSELHLIRHNRATLPAALLSRFNLRILAERAA